MNKEITRLCEHDETEGKCGYLNCPHFRLYIGDGYEAMQVGPNMHDKP